MAAPETSGLAEAAALILSVVASFVVPGFAVYLGEAYFGPGLLTYALFMSLYPLIVVAVSGVTIATTDRTAVQTKLTVEPDGFVARYAPNDSWRPLVRGAAFGAATVWCWIALTAGLFFPSLTGFASLGVSAFTFGLVLAMAASFYRFANRFACRESTLELKGAVLRSGDRTLVLHEGFDVSVSGNALVVESGEDALRVDIWRDQAESIARQIRESGAVAGDAGSIPGSLQALRRDRAQRTDDCSR